VIGGLVVVTGIEVTVLIVVTGLVEVTEVSKTVLLLEEPQTRW